ncbi:helix-turn-helix transcriptional regulator [Enterobacteriaceae bacterium C34A]
MHTECKTQGAIISRTPIVQAGLTSIMAEHFPEYEMSCHQSIDELTLLQAQRSRLIVCDFTPAHSQGKALCERYYALMTQFTEARWIFLVNQENYPLAVEFLLRPESTLLSEAEPVCQLIAAIRHQGARGSRISNALTEPAILPAQTKASLSRSERQVLRLLAKGWAVSQVALLLRKSNKTVSAQKNSAMRRLALRGNAELYAWLSSVQGMKELNRLTAWGETAEWKMMPGADASQSLKTVP